MSRKKQKIFLITHQNYNFVSNQCNLKFITFHKYQNIFVQKYFSYFLGTFIFLLIILGSQKIWENFWIFTEVCICISKISIIEINTKINY